MSEFLTTNQSINVRHVNPSMISDAREHKALLAMQATTLLSDDGFDSANERLMDAAQNLGVAPTMTYEDLIFVNPLEKGAYVLSEESDVAEQEVLFYVAHNTIEAELGTAIDALQAGDHNTATELINLAGKSFGRLYRQLDPGAFARFRPYFVGINGYPGPSGLFTAAIPIIDLLSHGGRNMSDEERSRLLADTERGLYPSHQSELLRELLLADSPELDMPDTVRDNIITLLNKFRRVHKGSVRKFVPQALDAGAEGSGGVANVAGYLTSK